MITLENITKTFRLYGKTKVVARNISVVFPTGKVVALLGRNGAGKSSLLKIIAGTMSADSGSVRIRGSVSWPVGYGGSFHPDLTGVQNTRFIARVYGVDSDELVESVLEFSELGDSFNLPVRSYSSGMRSRLAFGVSMGIDFDTYLVDEVTAVGDASFKKKSEAVFSQRMRSSGAIMVTHALGQVQRLCHNAAVLENGILTYYQDVNEAILHHQEIMKRRADED